MQSLTIWRKPARTSRINARRSSVEPSRRRRLPVYRPISTAWRQRPCGCAMVEEEARKALQDAEQARDAARERYRLCQRAVIKLDRLAEQERRKADRLEEAYAEADLDERAIMAAASTSEQGWA